MGHVKLKSCLILYHDVVIVSKVGKLNELTLPKVFVNVMPSYYISPVFLQKTPRYRLAFDYRVIYYPLRFIHLSFSYSTKIYITSSIFINFLPTFRMTIFIDLEIGDPKSCSVLLFGG